MRSPSELAKDLVLIDDEDAVTQMLIEWGREVAAESREVKLAGFTEERDGPFARLVGTWHFASKETR